jgi:hypothetical protein
MDGDLTGCIAGPMAATALLVVYVWVQLYKLWRAHFSRRALTGFYQHMLLLGWLFFVAVAATITLFFLRLFTLF